MRLAKLQSSQILQLILFISMCYFAGCGTKETKNEVDLKDLNRRMLANIDQSVSNAVRMVEKKLLMGANANAADTNGVPAIVHASESTEDVRFGLAKLLIDHGADINAANRQGETALKHFCMRADTACLNLVLANNVNVTVVDSFGYTPLLLLTMQVSAYNKQMEEKGSDKHNELFWNTPLARIAAEDYNLPYIKEFLKRGADPHHKSKDGESAYSIAKEYDLNLIREAIEQHLQKDNKQ